MYAEGNGAKERKDKKKEGERGRGKRLDYYYYYYYYFAVSYKYSFLLLDESGRQWRLALQAVSRVKSANERPLQAPRRAPPLGFPLPLSFSLSLLSFPPPVYPVSFLRSNSARQPRGAPSCANLFN